MRYHRAVTYNLAHIKEQREKHKHSPVCGVGNVVAQGHQSLAHVVLHRRVGHLGQNVAHLQREEKVLKGVLKRV